MAHTENTIQSRKNQLLSFFERGEITALKKKDVPNREIARRVNQTTANELKRGTTTQLNTGRQSYTASPKPDKLCMNKTEKDCGAKDKLLLANEFINFACNQITSHDWSPDAVIGYSKHQTK